MKDIPVTILGGSDHRPGPLPEDKSDLHSIGTCKGADITIGGKRLIEWLVENMNETEGFGPVTIAGPNSVYQPLNLAADIVDTDGSVGQNLRAAIDHHNASFGPDTPMAVLTYDIFLQPSELAQLRKLYEEDQSCSFWMPFVRKPEDTKKLGPFEWKPTYQFVLENEAEPVDILPGHLAIFTPGAIEWDLLLRVLDLAYETRNHSITQRKNVLVRKILMDLIHFDFQMIKKGRCPRFTASILFNGIRLANELRKGQLNLRDSQRMVGAMFLRRHYPGKNWRTGIKHPIVNILGLAEDVDTEEEAKGVEEMHSDT